MSLFTGNGVEISSLQDWLNRVIAFKQSVWGTDFVIDPTTKQGADILQLAELLYNAEMSNVSAYAQLNPNQAVGVGLDYIGRIRGLQRNPGFPQQIVVAITSSTTGYFITPDLVFRTLAGNNYYSPTTVEITNTEQQVTLLSVADGNPDTNPGDTLQTVTQFTNITNAQIIQGGVTPGQPTEDDLSFRTRINNSDIGFIGTLELMYSELLTVPGLAKANFYYNDSEVTDSRGITPFATEFLTEPQDGVDDTTFNNLVAQKILEVKVPGSPTYGNTAVNVTNFLGEPKVILFTRPDRQSVQFFAQIALNPNTGQLNISNVPMESQMIMDFVNSLRIGANLNWSKVLGFISSDTGFVIQNWGLRFKDTTPWVQTDLSIGIREYAWIDSLADIDIATDAPTI